MSKLIGYAVSGNHQNHEILNGNYCKPCGDVMDLRNDENPVYDDMYPILSDDNLSNCCACIKCGASLIALANA